MVQVCYVTNKSRKKNLAHEAVRPSGVLFLSDLFVLTHEWHTKFYPTTTIKTLKYKF